MKWNRSSHDPRVGLSSGAGEEYFSHVEEPLPYDKVFEDVGRSMKSGPDSEMRSRSIAHNAGAVDEDMIVGNADERIDRGSIFYPGFLKSYRAILRTYIGRAEFRV